MMQSHDDLEARLRRDAEAVRHAAGQHPMLHRRIMGRLAAGAPASRVPWGSRIPAQVLVSLLFTVAAAGIFLLLHHFPGIANGPVKAPGAAVPIETAQFLNPQVGVVVTQRGLLITRNGGQTWQLTLRLDWHSWHDIRFIDSQHIIVVSSSTVPPPAEPVPLLLYTTADGGNHWKASSIAPITAGKSRSPFFINDREGWDLVYSGDDPSHPTMAALYRTTDGGAHWTLLHRVDASQPSSGGLQLASAPEDLFFTDSAHGFMGTASHDNVARLFVTQDGGLSWRAAVVAQPYGGSVHGGGDQTQVTLAANVTMFGASGFLTQASGPSVAVYSTSDQGRTWGGPRLLPFAKGRAYFLDRMHWWVTGEGMLYETVDGGASWQRLPDVSLDIWPYLQALGPSGPQVFWGQLLQSSIPGDSPIAGVPASACFPAPSGPDCSFLVRSTDGGHHWTDVKLPVR